MKAKTYNWNNLWIHYQPHCLSPAPVCDHYIKNFAMTKKKGVILIKRALQAQKYSRMKISSPHCTEYSGLMNANAVNFFIIIFQPAKKHYRALYIGIYVNTESFGVACVKFSVSRAFCGLAHADAFIESVVYSAGLPF